MAATKQPSVQTQFKALSSGARLDVLALESGGDNLHKSLDDGDVLSRLPPRRHLYFDEQARITLLLQTKGTEEQLRAILSEVEIALAAHATDAVPQGSGNAASASGKHDLDSTVVPGQGVDNVVASGDYVYAIWKPTLHLTRPQARLQRPAVYFTAYLRVTTKALRVSRERAAEWMKPYEPLSANLLESLNFDPAIGSRGVYLPESLITKTAPSPARAEDEVKPIRGASKRAFPIVPALFTRIKYSTLLDSLVASLHLETSRLVTGSIAVRDVVLDVLDAQVKAISSFDREKVTKAGDETVLMYRVKPQRENSGSDPSPVFARVEAMLYQNEHSSIKLEIKWQTKVDLSSLGVKPAYKWSRPLSIGSQQAARLSIQDAQHPFLPEVDSNPSTNEKGVIFNFTAPSMIHKDEELELAVHCVNRSERQRRFGLMTLQPPGLLKTMLNKQKAGREESFDHARRSAESPRTEHVEPLRRPHVIDLNPEFRIGPLPPGACFETKMNFHTLTLGKLDLGVLRIIDLDSGQTVDVKNLPDVIVMDTRSPRAQEVSVGTQQEI